MKHIMENIWLSATAIFLFQVIFVYLRTINVIYTSEKKTLAAIVSGAFSGLFWILSTALGVASIMEGQWIPIVAHILGGSLGTYWGIESEVLKKFLNRLNLNTKKYE